MKHTLNYNNQLSNFNKAPQNSLNNNSPYSNNYVSKSSSNYQYRPQTTLIDKFDLMEQSLPSSERGALLYRSQVNPYTQYYKHRR
jgi:hypothetical protein